MIKFIIDIIRSDK